MHRSTIVRFDRFVLALVLVAGASSGRAPAGVLVDIVAATRDSGTLGPGTNMLFESFLEGGTLSTFELNGTAYQMIRVNADGAVAFYANETDTVVSLPTYRHGWFRSSIGASIANVGLFPVTSGPSLGYPDNDPPRPPGDSGDTKVGAASLADDGTLVSYVTDSGSVDTYAIQALLPGGTTRVGMLSTNALLPNASGLLAYQPDLPIAISGSGDGSLAALWRDGAVDGVWRWDPANSPSVWTFVAATDEAESWPDHPLGGDLDITTIENAASVNGGGVFVAARTSSVLNSDLIAQFSPAGSSALIAIAGGAAGSPGGTSHQFLSADPIEGLSMQASDDGRLIFYARAEPSSGGNSVGGLWLWRPGDSAVSPLVVHGDTFVTTSGATQVVISHLNSGSLYLDGDVNGFVAVAAEAGSNSRIGLVFDTTTTPPTHRVVDAPSGFRVDEIAVNENGLAAIACTDNLTGEIWLLAESAAGDLEVVARSTVSLPFGEPGNGATRDPDEFRLGEFVAATAVQGRSYLGFAAGFELVNEGENSFRDSAIYAAAVEPCIDSCPGDFDGSGVVDGPDLAYLMAAWGKPAPCADLNGDGMVGGDDLSVLLAAWGPCP